MAIRIDYLAKETGNNLVRNPTLTAATVLTVSVSLALLGTALLISEGVSNLETHFKGDVEFIVWMDPSATDENVEVVRNFLDDSEAVRSQEWIDKEATFEQFQEFFADRPEILDLVDPDQLPPSFAVVPEFPDLALIRAIGADIEAFPGVSGVDYEEEFIKQLNTLSSRLSRIMIIAALLSAVASALLMYNTIRTGLFARRREIEVMRLVGATKWFIRIPFMLEGLLQGVIGAIFAAIAVFGLNKAIASSLAEMRDFQLFQNFALPNGEVLEVVVIIGVAGAVLGFVMAGVAVTKYLDA